MEKYIAIAEGGMPSILRQGLASVAMILLNRTAGLYGDAAIAAMSIVQRVCFFIYAGIIGFGQGFQPVCGFCYGARLYQRIKEAFWFCVRTSTLILILFSILGIAFAPQILEAFGNGNAEIMHVGVPAIRFQFAVFPLLGFVLVSNMMLQTINKYKQASLIAMGRQGLFFMPLILALPPLFGLTGVQIAQPIADMFTFGLAIPLTGKVLKESLVGKPRS